MDLGRVSVEDKPCNESSLGSENKENNVSDAVTATLKFGKVRFCVESLIICLFQC